MTGSFSRDPPLHCAAPLCTSRRRFVSNALTLGAAGVAHCQPSSAQPAGADPTNPFRIDIHHHFTTPGWVKAVAHRERLNVRARDWAPVQSIDDMDKNGVRTAMLSITNPGLWFGDRETTRALARECNEYGAKLVREHPTRFGLFAAMPMPHIDASLREITHAFDHLGCDGIGLFTNYGDKWLGHADFAPVFEELNRRKALVFTHPSAANCCGNLIAEVPASLIEYGTDTTRAIASLLFTGTAARYPDIRFTFSHGGGTLPFLIERFLRLERTTAAGLLPRGLMHELRKFHYDLASVTHAIPLGALLKLVPVSQILFGTDFPSAGTIEPSLAGLHAFGLSAADLMAIERDNALRLVPRLSRS